MAHERAGHLRRSVGFWGLTFISLGSIIGSGWLLGALQAAQLAGPASILSWILTAGMLSLLALTYAELGAAYPVAGGSGRFPYYCHGPIAGFTAGWASWLQAVFIAPTEALAMIKYLNSVDAIHAHVDMMSSDGLLHGVGFPIAIGLMVVFTAINLGGAKFMSESNTVLVIWKTAVPVLALAVVAGARFDTGNFSRGGGFMPHGFHGVFEALTAGGVVFSLQGFEQAVQLAGEARDPKKDLARAVLTAMAIGAVIYCLLQVVMIGAFDPAYLTDWSNPLGGEAAKAGGAWYTLALAVGLGWLAKMLLVDAIVSPGGTGIVYVGTSARLSYALGEEREMPSALARTNQHGVPVVSILVAAVVGCLAFGPLKSWKEIVEVVTAATAIMYGFAPISLAALHRLDAARERPYRVPMPKLLLPAAFCSANLIVYWGGFATAWKLGVAMLVGLVLFAIGAWRGKTGAEKSLRSAGWIAAWLGGHVLLGAIGRYSGGDVKPDPGGPWAFLPEWYDLGVVIAFSLAIFYVALYSTLAPAASQAEIAKDAHQIEYDKAPPALAM